MKKHAFYAVIVIVLFLASLPGCRKEVEERPLTWQEKYTGNYTFTTIYHDAMYFMDDTSVFPGASTIYNESTHQLRIDYTPSLTIYPHVSDTGNLAIENIGSHDYFSGHFSLDGKSIHFYRSSYYESWDVTGEKKE